MKLSRLKKKKPRQGSQLFKYVNRDFIRLFSFQVLIVLNVYVFSTYHSPDPCRFVSAVPMLSLVLILCICLSFILNKTLHKWGKGNGLLWVILHLSFHTLQK